MHCNRALAGQLKMLAAIVSPVNRLSKGLREGWTLIVSYRMIEGVPLSFTISANRRKSQVRTFLFLMAYEGAVATGGLSLSTSFRKMAMPLAPETAGQVHMVPNATSIVAQVDVLPVKKGLSNSR